jgi:hypothetical protein
MNTLFIYTTGIADWGNMGIIEFWETRMFGHILAQVKPLVDIGFISDIKVRHYDPLISITGRNREVKKQQYIDRLSAYSDGQDTIFIDDYLPVDKIMRAHDVHLIIDFAHIFHYNPVGFPMLNGVVKPGLTVVYSGYVGDNEHGNQKNIQLALSDKFIYLDRYGEIKTYVNLIVECFGTLDVKLNPGLPSDSIYPFDDVAEAVTVAKKSISTQWRARFKRVDDRYDDYIHTILTINAVMEVLVASRSKQDFIQNIITLCNEAMPTPEPER